MRRLELNIAELAGIISGWYGDSNQVVIRKFNLLNVSSLLNLLSPNTFLLHLSFQKILNLKLPPSNENLDFDHCIPSKHSNIGDRWVITVRVLLLSGDINSLIEHSYFGLRRLSVKKSAQCREVLLAYEFPQDIQDLLYI